MPSYQECVKKALTNKQISQILADRISKADDPDAAINEILAETSRLKREAAIQAVRYSQNAEKVRNHPDGIFAGLMSLLSKHTRTAGYQNVEYLGNVLASRYHSQLAEMYARLKPKRLGFYEETDAQNKFVRAIYGEDVGDPDIMKWANDFKGVTEKIRQDFNAAGGSVSKNEQWLLPQNHDARAISELGRDAWKRMLYNPSTRETMLDRSLMLNDQGVPLDDTELDDLLNYVYESITTRGLNKVKEGSSLPRLGQKLARRGSEKRILYFKDANSWIGYHEKFGKGTIFSTLTTFIDNRANDIALMRVLGPNPEAAYRALDILGRKEGLTPRQAGRFESTFNVVSGRINQGEMTSVSDFFQVPRNIITASTLGGAWISSISDIAFQTATAKFNSIPAMKVLSRQMKLMNPANAEDQLFAEKIGLIADSTINTALTNNRYSDTYGVGKSAKVAEAVMRASLLQPWTEAGRKAFGMEFAAMLAENFNKSLDQLDPVLQRQFKAYDISEKSWDTFRKTAPLDHKGVKFADVTQEAGEDFHRLILSETDLAVPTPDATVRSILTGGHSRGTVTGQLWRSAFMIKSFPITIAMSHFHRAAFAQVSMGTKLTYTGTLLAMTSALGGVALLAKDVVAGRDPRPVDNPEFLVAAISQGGGLGLLGDFVFSDANRFGGGIVDTIIGPAGELVDTTTKFTLGNIQEAVRGEETNVLGESARILERYTPSVWQLALFKNALFDQLYYLADPKAEEKFRRQIRTRETDYDQEYWWRPGEIGPRRAPEFDITGE